MYLQMQDATFIEDRVYFASANFNALFCLDLKERRLDYVTYFSMYPKSQKELYGKQILHGKKIYFIPRLCHHMAVYDIDTKEIFYIDIAEKKADKVIRDAFIEGNELWMLCNSYPCEIFKVDLSTHQYQFIDVDCEMVDAYLEEDKLRKDSLRINFAKREGEDWQIELTVGKWITYNWKQGKVKSVYEKENLPFGAERMIEGKDIRFYMKLNGMVVVHKETKEIQEFSFKKKKSLLAWVFYEDKYLIFPTIGRGMLVFDTKSRMLEEYELEWHLPLTNDSVKDYFEGCLTERGYELDDFLQWVDGQETQSRTLENGKAIWKRLMFPERNE